MKKAAKAAERQRREAEAEAERASKKPATPSHLPMCGPCTWPSAVRSGTSATTSHLEKASRAGCHQGAGRGKGADKARPAGIPCCRCWAAEKPEHGTIGGGCRA